MKRMNSMMKHGRVALSVLALGGLALVPSAQAAPKPPTDWLWLSANETSCTWTVTVNWSGFKAAKTVQVFLTDGYAGTALAPTFQDIKSKDNTAVVTVTLAPSTTATYYYTWAQLLDSHGVAIPASLDFTGQVYAYCAP